MPNKSIIAICLCGMMWAGNAQAGFLGNNLELQFLQNLLGNLPVNVTVTGGVEIPNGPGGISVDIGDTTVDVVVPNSLQGPVGLNIVDINDSVPPITGASGNGPGTVSSGPNNVQITDLNAGDTQRVVVTVPEPGVLPLVVLGLTMLGMTTLLRRRVNA